MIPATQVSKEARRLLLLIQRDGRIKGVDEVSLGDHEAAARADIGSHEALKAAQIECKRNGWLTVRQGQRGARYTLSGTWNG